VQFVDVKDLARFMVDLSERRAAGAYNATHPGRRISDLLDACRDVSGSDAAFTWVPDRFLVEHDVGEWMELPLWIHDPEEAGMLDAIVTRALEAGLTFRPLEDTVRDTLRHAALVEGVGLSPEREAELLAAAQS
jgi:2'-hydroxyisoflavone reductase